MSDYVISLTPERSAAFPNTGPVLQAATIFVYQKLELGNVELDLFNFIPWRMCVIFAVLEVVNSYGTPSCAFLQPESHCALE